ncbi:hypothetical protein DRN32_06000 [Thermococci archaeon]|nr:MAG: hypothetical protein DRN32_06000 [Thermococci archaeon]
MSKRDYRLFLQDILESIERIEEYTEGYDFETFTKDRKTVDAVLRNLEIIGEAAKHIPENIRMQHPEIPWKRVIGLRNVVIHHYFGVDLSIVWVIIKKQLPELKDAVISLLEEI